MSAEQCEDSACRECRATLELQHAKGCVWYGWELLQVGRALAGVKPRRDEDRREALERCADTFRDVALERDETLELAKRGQASPMDVATVNDRHALAMAALLTVARA